MCFIARAAHMDVTLPTVAHRVIAAVEASTDHCVRSRGSLWLGGDAGWWCLGGQVLGCGCLGGQVLGCGCRCSGCWRSGRCKWDTEHTQASRSASDINGDTPPTARQHSHKQHGYHQDEHADVNQHGHVLRHPSSSAATQARESHTRCSCKRLRTVAQGADVFAPESLAACPKMATKRLLNI